MRHTEGVTVIDELSAAQFDAIPDAATVARAKRIRWQWYLLYNRVKSAPWNSATDTHLQRCEEVIAIIDALLAQAPTTH